MILTVATLLGVLSAALFGGRLRRIAALPLRSLWVVWGAIAVQFVAFAVFPTRLPETVSEAIHVGSFVMALTFLWLNRHIPGALAVGIGATCNLTAIVANGGVMPASAGAWQRSGLDQVPELQYTNSHVLDDPRLLFLGDVFAVPASWPLSNVFSVGDVIIAIAATYLAHAWCRAPRTSNAWPAPNPIEVVAQPVPV